MADCFFVFAVRIIPNVLHERTPLECGRNKSHANQNGHHLESAKSAYAATGSGNIFPKDDKPAFPFQGPRHGRVFRTEKSFVKTADCAEGFTGAKHKSAAGESRHPHEQTEPQ